MKRTVATIVLLISLLIPSLVKGETIHFNSPVTVTTKDGYKLDLDPGYYLDEPTWNKLDAELKRLQDTETQLKAENISLRNSLLDSNNGWKLAVGGVIVGLLAGVSISYAVK